MFGKEAFLNSITSFEVGKLLLSLVVEGHEVAMLFSVIFDCKIRDREVSVDV